LEDAFLVKHGLLSGKPQVERPAGVLELKEGPDYVAYR
jgi:hypothetical protein